MKKIHMIGIGGSGMSGLAGILKARGDEITGSDLHTTGHAATNIQADREAVIYSLAIPPSNPELKEARRQGISLLSYPEAVGELTKHYFTVAICGTHGKSTTTAFLSKILIENNYDPSVLIGTPMKELGNKNFRVGKSHLLILEACEYRRAFLHYQPRIILLNTIDPDHFDYYTSFDDYLHAFEQFARKLPSDGYFFCNLDDPDVHEIGRYLQKKQFPLHNFFTYSSQYQESTFFLNNNEIFINGQPAGSLELSIPGAHNRTNALGAFAIASVLGTRPPQILKSLKRYTGAARRFEMKGRYKSAVLIDDYAHHPAEIMATLQAARERYPTEKICVVFQPHQYSRTKILFKEFGAAFEKADCVLIPNIYAARDTAKDRALVSPERLVKEIKKYKKEVYFTESLEKTVDFLRQKGSAFEVIITMGAGDVGEVISKLLAH